MSDNNIPPSPPAASDAFPPSGIPQTPSPQAGRGPRKSSGFGIAALILGIIALVFSLIPFANYFGLVVGVVGLILGIVGLLVKGRSRGLPLTGTILSGLALVLAIVMIIVYAAAFSAAVNAVKDAGTSIISSSSPSASSDSGDGKAVDVVYEVTSDAATATSISYLTVNNGQSGQEQASGASLPWSKDLQLKTNGVLDFNAMSLTAQAAQDATTITCTIKVDGVVKSTQTSTGSFSVVSCSTAGK